MATLALLTAACGGSEQALVVVLGDSITALVDGQAREELDDGDHEVEVAAQPGATTERRLQVARRLAEREPEEVIVNLGTNDVLSSAPIPDAAADLREMVALFPEASCVALTTIHEHMPRSLDPSAHEEAAALNEEIRALARSDPRITVIEWNATVEASDAALLRDEIHPNPRGQQVLVEEYRAFVDGCAPD